MYIEEKIDEIASEMKDLRTEISIIKEMLELLIPNEKPKTDRAERVNKAMLLNDKKDIHDSINR